MAVSPIAAAARCDWAIAAEVEVEVASDARAVGSFVGSVQLTKRCTWRCHPSSSRPPCASFVVMAGLATDLVQVFRTGRANH
jgi:hypothetical protein